MDMYNFFLNFFPIVGLLMMVFPFILAIYFLLQFLRVNRERNDLLYQILEELRKKNAGK